MEEMNPPVEEQALPPSTFVPKLGEPIFGDLTKYIHISRTVYKIEVYGDPLNAEKVTRVNTVVENKGHTRTNELERHLRKQNPKVFFNRGEKGSVGDDSWCGVYISGTKTKARRREEALCA